MKHSPVIKHNTKNYAGELTNSMEGMDAKQQLRYLEQTILLHTERMERAKQSLQQMDDADIPPELLVYKYGNRGKPKTKQKRCNFPVVRG
jgi:hypothetical protein